MSHVINNAKRVSPEMRRRVEEAMANLAYTPPPPTRRRGPRPINLRETSTKRLALVAWHVSTAALRSPLYVDVVHGIEIAARERGCSVLLHRVTQGLPGDFEDLSRQADGIVFFGRDLSCDFTADAFPMPCVKVMGTFAGDTWCDHVSYDNPFAARLAADYLLTAGHKHCAVILQDSDPFDSAVYGRTSIFTETVKARGGTVTELKANRLVDESGACQVVRREILLELIGRVLATRPRPTGLFLPTDILAPAVYTLLSERNVRAGHDMTVVSCNNESPLIANLYPKPASVDLHVDHICERAVDQLIWRMAHPTAPQITISVSPTLQTE